MRLALGIDVGGTSIKAGLVREDGVILVKASDETEAESGPDAVLGRIAGIANKLAGQDKVQGIGIGVPGAVALDGNTVSHPPNFRGWGRIQVASRLVDLLGLDVPILVENDCNAAALGSNRHGAGRAFTSFIMVTLGTGVGGAIMTHGKLFRGDTGAAGEIGHMTIDYEGPRAKSGVPGALEAYLGQRYLSAHALHLLETRPDSLVHEKIRHAEFSPQILHEAAVEGDADAIEILGWAGHKLGCGLGSAVNLLDIRKIVVGGGLSAAGDFLLEPARKSLIQFVTPALHDDLEIVRETRGNDVGILGAAELVFRAC